MATRGLASSNPRNASAAGQTIVLHPPDTLTDGMRVTIRCEQPGSGYFDLRPSQLTTTVNGSLFVFSTGEATRKRVPSGLTS